MTVKKLPAAFTAIIRKPKHEKPLELKDLVKKGKSAKGSEADMKLISDYFFKGGTVEKPKNNNLLPTEFRDPLSLLKRSLGLPRKSPGPDNLLPPELKGPKILLDRPVVKKPESTLVTKKQKV